MSYDHRESIVAGVQARYILYPISRFISKNGPWDLYFNFLPWPVSKHRFRWDLNTLCHDLFQNDVFGQDIYSKFGWLFISKPPFWRDLYLSNSCLCFKICGLPRLIRLYLSNYLLALFKWILRENFGPLTETKTENAEIHWILVISIVPEILLKLKFKTTPQVINSRMNC